MTDTIGWGPVDVDPARLRRRRRRVLRLVTPIAVVVVAAVLVTPVVKRDLAAGAARWLQHEWALQNAYGDARDLALTAAVAHVGVGDAGTFARLVVVLDRQDADRLAAIDTSVRHHQTWTTDVSRARAAVLGALRGEIADLRAEARHAGRPEHDRLAVSAPDPLTATTLSLVHRADAAVAAADAAHHVRLGARPVVRLDAGRSIIGQLDRPTDVPLDLRLVVAAPDGYVRWDLSDGSHRLIQPDVADSIDAELPVVGAQALLVTSPAQTELVPLNGSPPRSLPSSDTYFPDGRGNLWRLRDGGVQRLSITGRLLGAARSLPHGYDFSGTTSTDLVMLSRFVPAGPPTNGHAAGLIATSFLWRPDDGRLIPAADACGTARATATVILYVTCDSDRLVIHDTTTSRAARAVRLGGFVIGNAAISADGRRVAVATFRGGVPDTSPWRLDVVDLTTGAVTGVDDRSHAVPVAWSSDGSTLVLGLPDRSTACCEEGLAYWSTGMPRIAAIRVPLEAGVLEVAALP